MCGRFTLRTKANKLLLELGVEDSGLDWNPRYNIAPTQSVLAVRQKPDGEDREAVKLRWGLVPSWSKDLAVGARMINARAETIAAKPSFRTAFKKHRCVVIADGFYEWRKVGKSKQPYYIQLADKMPFAFAGLWEKWKGSGDEPVETCTVITTEPNSLMAEIHDRMPVILEPNKVDLWLDRDVEGIELLQSLLVPYDPSEMTAYATNPIVGNVMNDSPACLQPVEAC